jgi:hypothetical protein
MSHDHEPRDTCEPNKGKNFGNANVRITSQQQ